MHTSALPSDWAFRPALDLELKQYILLAYLQRVKQRFAEHKLYPHLDELHLHLEELLRVQRSKDELARGLNTPLMGFDPRTGQALHAPVEQPAPLDVIDAVIEFALPGLRKALAHGRDLRAELAGRIRFEPVGLVPLRPTEGWLMLRHGAEARVYHYAMPLLREHRDEHQYRSVVTRFAGSWTVSVAHTYEHIRRTLLRQHQDMPVAATFVFEADVRLPPIETFMPLAKQLVYEVIAAKH